ncbi:MAG: hypothetical protein LBJ77_01705 [Holosporales bacterium]|nr:hypothetical protein [Holosporales bacterium]
MSQADEFPVWCPYVGSVMVKDLGSEYVAFGRHDAENGLACPYLGTVNLNGIRLRLYASDDVDPYLAEGWSPDARFWPQKWEGWFFSSGEWMRPISDVTLGGEISLNILMSDYMYGYFSELYSYKLPHLGKLGWFWRKMHSAWDDVTARFPGALGSSEDGDCSPSNFLKLVEFFAERGSNNSWIRKAGIFGAGLILGGFAMHHLFGRKYSSRISIHKIKRI